MSECTPHCELGPEACPECWFEGIGPGRGKPEKPLSQCIEGLLRYTAEAWKVERLAARARVVEQRLAAAAQAMLITDNLREWANAEVAQTPPMVGGNLPMHVGPEAYEGFEAAQAEVQWFLDDAVRWDKDKGVVS